MRPPLTASFLRGANQQELPVLDIEFERSLAALYQAAALNYTDVQLPADAFCFFLGERFPPGALPEPSRAADCYLACACASGLPRAVAAFERVFDPVLRKALGKLRLSPVEMDEALAKIKRELLVAPEDAPARIVTYGGSGDLAGWLKVSVVRSAMKMFRGKEREVLVDDQEVFASGLPTPPDVELDYLKAIYRPVFSRAFRQALGALPAKQRAILRQHTLDGLSIDDLGRLYGVHRATVARWLQAAREDLLQDTKRRLAAEAEISSAECDSILRLVQSQLDMTVRSWFSVAG